MPSFSDYLCDPSLFTVLCDRANTKCCVDVSPAPSSFVSSCSHFSFLLMILFSVPFVLFFLFQNPEVKQIYILFTMYINQTSVPHMH